jgi:hypothetical protein
MKRRPSGAVLLCCFGIDVAHRTERACDYTEMIAEFDATFARS